MRFVFSWIMPFAASLLVAACCSEDDATRAGSEGSRAGAPGANACASGPLAEPIPDCRPAAPPSSGDPAQDCVDRVNQLRWECQCLPPLERWTEGEVCADTHAEHDSTHTAHAGFSERICTPSGSAQNECPGWPSVEATISSCLQQMWNEGPGKDFREHGHYLNLTTSHHTRVACGFFTTSNGHVWMAQNFQ